MGVLSSVIDAGQEYRNPLEEVEDGLFVGIGARSAKLTQFWTLLVLASIIAAGGVIGDSTPAVIGAMIVAPLATPIYGVALATVTGSRKDLRDALLLLVSGIAVNILIGAVIGLITFERFPVDANPQIIGRTAPTMLDLAVAITTGVAGSFALVRKDIVNILAGVAIAISLVPVLAVVGITLGSGRPDLAWGAFLLFLANAMAIIVAGVVVFTAAGYQRDAAARGAHVGRRAKWLIAAILVILIIPLGLSSLRTYSHERWVSATRSATEHWVAGTGYRVTNVREVSGEIIAGVIGEGDLPPVAGLRAEIRSTVPAGVPVEVIAESGRSTQL
jgi:uncharacterized hydrophobic protein (TIGR00271 family)